MKPVDKKNSKKQKLKKKPIAKPKNEKVLVVAQEFKFALLLSGNEKKTRDRVLKSLKKWLTNCFEKNYAFKEDDFIRVWKGLFYAMWMSDKPLVQEDLSESIAHILDLFPKDQFKNAVLMTKAGFKVLALEWYGIDQHRYDKFLMLVRRYLRGSFRCIERMKWDLESCKLFANMLSNEEGLLALNTPHYARNANSLIQHIIECYLEELSKVSKGKILDESLVELLEPFLVQVCGDNLTLSISSRQLLNDLIKQSDLGLKYTSAYEAWRQMGCPAGGPEALELQSDDELNDAGDDVEDEEISTALDPRAGHVDVVLTPLPVPAGLLAARIKKLMSKATSRSYRRARLCLQRLEELSRDKYPLTVKSWDSDGVETPLQVKDKLEAVQSLNSLEKKLVTDSDELALRGLRRKHRKRLLAKSRAGLSIVEDVQTDTQTDDNNEQVKSAGSKKAQRNKVKKRKSVGEKTDTLNKKPKVTAAQNVAQNDNEKKDNKKAKNTTKKVVNTQEKDISSIQNSNKSKENNNLSNSVKVKKNIKLSKEKQSNSIAGKKVLNEVKQNNSLGGKKEASEAKQNNTLGGKKELSEIRQKNSKALKKEVSETKAGKKEISEVKHRNGISNNSKAIKKDSTDEKNKSVTKNVGGKVKNYQKRLSDTSTPKRVKFVLKNNCMQGTIDYYKSVRQSPNIPFDSSKKPPKTNLKPSTPSPINPFFKRKLRMKS